MGRTTNLAAPWRPSQWPIAAALTSLALAACGDSGDGVMTPPESPTVGAVELSAVSVQLELGDSTQLQATVRDSESNILTAETVTWTSNTPQTVEVSADGWVRGLAEGSGSVTASAGGQTASASVQVFGYNIAENAVVVDSAALFLLSDSLERSQGTYRFQVLQPPAPEIENGDVIVGAQELGFLRRVVSASTAGDVITLETEQAALSEIIESGSFQTTIDLDFTAPLEPTPAPLGPLSNGDVRWGETRVMRLIDGASLGAAGINLSGLDICKLLAAGSSAGGTTCPSSIKKLQIKTGVLDFSPNLEVEADFESFSLESFRGVAQGAVTADFAVLLEAETSATLFPQIEIVEITRPFYGQLGPVPVLGYVELTLKGGLEVKATAKGSIEAGFTNNHTVDIGAEWTEETGWTPIFESQRMFNAMEPSLSDGTLKGQIDLETKLSIKPELKVIFYGVVGPFLNVEPYGKATLTFGTMSCGFSSGAGINSEIGFTIPFLDPSVANFSRQNAPWFEWPGRGWDCPLGTLDVHTITNGADPDDDGYTILVDEEDKGLIGSTDDRTIDFVEVGSRKILLDGVAPNCTVQGDNPKTVTVVTLGIHPVNFDVDCTALGGDLDVSVHTDGDNLDLDGYSVTLDGGTSQSIGVQGQTSFASVAEGMHEVELSGLASNCSVQGDNPVSVEVIAGMPAQVAFNVSCTVAQLNITTTTSGTPLTTEWIVTLNEGPSEPIGPNDLVTFEPAPGSYQVTLENVATNCTVQSPNPQNVSVPAAGDVNLTFQVTCQGAGLTVNVSTEGDPDPATSYTVRVNGSETMSVSVNGSVNFTNLPQGSNQVGLENVPSHCLVLGSNPRSVDAPGQTTFQVLCEEPVFCEMPPGTAQLYPDTYVEEPSGTSVTAIILANDWGDVSVSTSASGGSAYGLAASGVVDNIFIEPVDAARAGEAVILRVHLQGRLETTATGIPSTHTVVEGELGSPTTALQFNLDPSFDESEASSDIDEIVELEFKLAEWGRLWFLVRAISGNSGPGSNTASGNLRIVTFVDVRDSGGGEVAVTNICSESGTEY